MNSIFEGARQDPQYLAMLQGQRQVDAVFNAVLASVVPYSRDKTGVELAREKQIIVRRKIWDLLDGRNQ